MSNTAAVITDELAPGEEEDELATVVVQAVAVPTSSETPAETEATPAETEASPSTEAAPKLEAAADTEEPASGAEEASVAPRRRAFAGRRTEGRAPRPSLFEKLQGRASTQS